MVTKGPVLVVEDHDDARDAMALALEAAGYEVVGASTGRDALDLIEAGKTAPCIVLLDLMLPGMNGWDFREALSKLPQVAHVPVIYVSALKHTLDTLQAGEWRAAAAMAKPVDMGELIALVGQHCLKA
jgi:DNA-binding response OmpR family regulator